MKLRVPKNRWLLVLVVAIAALLLLRGVVWDWLFPPTIVLTGHTAAVTGVAYSPDGQMLASSSADDTVRLWHVQPPGPARVIKADCGGVNSVAFAPDGQTVAGGCVDHAVRLWRVADGVLLRTFQGHQDVVQGVGFTPD